MLQITDAIRHKEKAKIMLSGVSGSGKTTGALLIARGLVDSPQEIILIDTENRGTYNHNIFGADGRYKIAKLSPPYTMKVFSDAILECIKLGFKVIIIDGITPFWQGDGGMLEKKDSFGGDFSSWKKVNPDWKLFINTVVHSDIHLILTARAKADYVIEDSVSAGGRATKSPKKVGLKEDFREGLEYELNVHIRFDLDHIARAEKDNTGIFDGLYDKINITHGQKLRMWCDDGVDFIAPPNAVITSLEVAYSDETTAKLDKFRQFCSNERIKNLDVFLLKQPDEISLVKALDKVIAEIDSEAKKIAEMVTKEGALDELMQTFDTDKKKLLNHPLVIDAINGKN